ncbi:acetyl-CoA carboxylase biotin carboxyl carrier protein subunit [Dysgonomonas sp. Marseille-P4677]|uniref:biotin/lipoyl-containing protein n=1 Tax=Dysgonomonas sp. Marseille-P4677 TaxID=2364790 RepID=UPI0019120481|nr:biotin/lipoyl-containing protein [Dysgonomonas sp. Marseille-P4677]MBK5719943.1 acetyl-CoA carboxylase biotin carboxyl carrier protein subunit [Dysgonomonas sp. Marseille-P4677]
MKQFIYRINGQEYIVAVNKMEGDLAEVAVNGANYKVELVNSDEEVSLVTRPAAKAAPAPAAPKSATATPSANRPTGGGAGAVKSPLPGIVIGIQVNVGDEVKKGQTVAMLEAMKMENAIQAPVDGKVTEICVNTGDSVLEGVVLLTIG